jgi:hypothetical protein
MTYKDPVTTVHHHNSMATGYKPSWYVLCPGVWQAEIYTIKEKETHPPCRHAWWGGKEVVWFQASPRKPNGRQGLHSSVSRDLKASLVGIAGDK